MTELALLAGLLLGTAALAAALRRRNGTFRPADPTGASVVLGVADLGVAPRAPVTAVLISSPTCSTCPQVLRVLEALAAERPWLAVVEVDAVERIELVRRLDVMRTPTVLLLDADGAVRARTSGPMTTEQAEAALDALLSPTQELS